ncbi:MAG: SGNH/GDSL hydrolase family protein, partial [Chloroflexota bacterium]
AGAAVPPTPAPTASEASGEPAAARPLRYVALGDSFTAGIGLERTAERWPNQLVRALRPGVELDLVANLAAAGASTFEVLDTQLPALDGLDAELVSLQVGVNDVIRDVPLATYRANLERILDGAPAADGEPAVTGLLARLPAARILLVETPDYTRAPRGTDYRRPGDAAAIAEANVALRAVAAARGIAVVAVAPIADLVSGDPTLIAPDGLHPSGKQLAGWVELIAPVVRGLVGG